MMEFLTIVYLFYTFIAIYFLLIYILLYFQNKKEIYETVKPKKEYSLSIVVPCYNESKSIGRNIESLINSDYKGLKNVIVVDDCSKDNSYEIIKGYEKKYPGIVIALQTPINTGCAAGSKNYGAKFAKTELIGFSDADSFPRKDAISKMVGYFNDTKTGAVTSRVLVENRVNSLSKIQAIEYKIIAFTRKLLEFLDSIYVTNGPLSIYRMKAFKEVRGFDETNLTEDIEITWNFVSRGWKVKMAIPSRVYSVVPEKLGAWFNQRVRWNVGGVQTVVKYKNKIASCGMLGLFILPFFVLSWFLGITGLFFLTYRVGRFVFLRFLVTSYSLTTQTAILHMQEINLNPSILFLFGIFLFLMGFVFTVIALAHSREKDRGRTQIYDIFIYSLFYLLMYPPLLIYSFYQYLKGRNTW